MITTTVKTSLNAPAKAVWSIIGAVGGVDRWSPVITSCELRNSTEGGLQRICGSEQGTLKEKILTLDNENRILSYAITEQPFLPITDLVSTIHISAEGEGTLLTTKVEYNLKANADGPQVEEMLHQIYGMSYQGIEVLLANPVTV